MPSLVSPEARYKDSYAAALREGLHLAPKSEGYIRLVETDFDEYLRQRYDLSIPLIQPDGTPIPKVPQTDFWLVEEDRFLGSIVVRPQMNENLLKYGGHIGYAVRKSERCKGYGTLQLKLVLPHVKAMGLEKVLITCDDDNPGSIAIIEGVGGRFENKLPVDGNVILKRRYWLRL